MKEKLQKKYENIVDELSKLNKLTKEAEESGLIVKLHIDGSQRQVFIASGKYEFTDKREVKV